ncbi:copper resistance protein [Rhizobium herbae]|uniref:Cupredoxin-like copper-binding protein n=1 Tax=Rhizobium herbae TaxID=508661 RepID=A0ABS4ERK2_9HYPH|nr:copper resistance protein [Rhizobium herbae]MBP1860580.1 putative cupredoxin-like copper-binding protein [Rhizobium herbae]
MVRIPRAILATVAATALTFTAFPSWADTTIKVLESGEGGGAMSLKLDPPTASPGPITFAVHNDAMSEEHEMVVVKLKSADQKIPLIKAKHRIDESKLKSMGEVADLKPGADGELKTNLKAGTYLVFCNLKGHYEAGMQTMLTVK